MDKIIPICKDPGITSFDVIREIKDIYKGVKIGHCGTLDPFAEGLLLVCTGKKTKEINQLVNTKKEYIAKIYFGSETDTLDSTGSIIRENNFKNIDREHLDHYDSFEDLNNSFDNFISNIPFYGVAICCIDNSEVHALVGRIKDRKIITYGFNKQADYSITEVDYQADRTEFKLQLLDKGVEEISFSLPMMGSHNVLNSVAAISFRDRQSHQ